MGMSFISNSDNKINVHKFNLKQLLFATIRRDALNIPVQLDLECSDLNVETVIELIAETGRP